MAEKKTIVDTMRERHATFVRDPSGNARTLEDLSDLSRKAVMGGIQSQEWDTLMKLYAVNDKQLARLRGQEGVVLGDWGEKALAYIASEGICSIDSLGGAGTGYFKDDDHPMVKFLVNDMINGEQDPTFNEVDENFVNG